MEGAAEHEHEHRTLGGAAESCIAADAPLEDQHFDASCARGLRIYNRLARVGTVAVRQDGERLEVCQ